MYQMIYFAGLLMLKWKLMISFIQLVVALMKWVSVYTIATWQILKDENLLDIRTYHELNHNSGIDEICKKLVKNWMLYQD